VRFYRPLTAGALIVCCGVALAIGSCATLGLGGSSAQEAKADTPDYAPPVIGKGITRPARPQAKAGAEQVELDPALARAMSNAQAKRKSAVADRPEGDKSDASMSSAAGQLQELFDQIEQARAEAERPAEPAPEQPVDEPLVRTLRPVQRPSPSASVSPAQAPIPPAPLTAPAAPTGPTGSTLTTTASVVAPAVPAPAPAAAPQPMIGASITPAKPEPTPEQRRSDAVAELARQLKPDVSAVGRPLAAGAPLIGLETIQPGAAREHLDALIGAAPSAERASVTVLRDLMKAAADDPTLSDPGSLAKALRDKADRLSGGVSSGDGALELGTVELCQRVEAFGRFTPLASSAFQAGRPASMILYTEVRNFMQRPAAGLASAEPADVSAAPMTQWATEIGQELRLILDADGSTQWRQAEGVVRDTSRSRRTDYFLVQRIDLPRTLSVGKYTLKVIVRDKSAGAEVETNIPIQIIADPSAVRKN
jgi:hypothetical protein